jgi:hypothetical protein
MMQLLNLKTIMECVQRGINDAVNTVLYEFERMCVIV